MKKLMVYAALIFTFLFGFYVNHLAKIVTVRNISKPYGNFLFPYDTHGGIVYVDKLESFILKFGLMGSFAVSLAIIIVAIIAKRASTSSKI